jgi:hypothetical protein
MGDSGAFRRKFNGGNRLWSAGNLFHKCTDDSEWNKRHLTHINQQFRHEHGANYNLVCSLSAQNASASPTGVAA